MLLPNINTILNMDIEDIIYPGFNRSLSELNAITKLKKKSCEILDFTEIEWVRDVLKQRINENNDLEKINDTLDKITEENDMVITIGAGTIWRYGQSYFDHLKNKVKA